MCLVLTRRIGETMMVGDDVYITVLGVKGNQVRLGIDAPKEIAVHREEIWLRINKEAGKGAYIPVRYRNSRNAQSFGDAQGAA